MKKIYFMIIAFMLACNTDFSQVSTRVSNGHAFFNFLGNKPWITNPFYGSRGTYFADVNGDGKADAITVNDYGVSIRTSTGNGFFNYLGNKPWTEVGYYGTRGTFFADVNGDGKADAIVVNDNFVTVRISDGTKFLPNAPWTTNTYYGTRGTFFADVNGDGKADAIVVNDNFVTVRISDGTKFLPNASWTINPYYGTRGTFFADVNGDGKADAIVVNDNFITVRISDGIKFLPNASWTNNPYYGTRGTFFADVNGDKKADAIVVNGPPNMVTKRISGVGYFNFVKADSKDGYTAQNGFLLVKHNPGCGIVGNDAADAFFGAAGKPLPPGCTILHQDFAQFWPSERGFDSPWSWIDDAGSYNAFQQAPPYKVRWHNACTGAYSGKDLYYVVSYLISMPEWTVLAEPTFEPGGTLMQSFMPPARYGWMQVPPPVPDGGTGKPQPQPTLYPFYFKVTCDGIFHTCTTVLQLATTQAVAKTAVQNTNPDCTVEVTDYDGYINACNR